MARFLHAGGGDGAGLQTENVVLPESRATARQKQTEAEYIRWDGYLEDLETTGLPRLMEIYQAALDRYYEELDQRS
ncbi:hypothetical protein [Actinomyces sp. MRS3W]|uniref:hypothetical protein n=1 Tax=Actinomyces sp. MRS3W TaxID=2800796 RepID=UPI0028FD32FF|nr:hypothetical protein [Actinomyces sp. MRS3W]MDU0348644.1 hypothetical protein [Actinomyces sp. MRS3W]